MPPDSPAPEDIDVTRPSPARVYDYLLGGNDNYQVDREAAEGVLAIAPELATVAVENRRFLIRTVRHLADEGFDQFLDLGSGLPTQENVHQVAHAANPRARVVYVDHDPMVLTHARALLGGGRNNTAYVHADIREPGTVLRETKARELLDFTRPVVVLCLAVLHYVGDEDNPPGLVAAYAAELPFGSRVVIASGSSDGLTDELRARIDIYSSKVPAPLVLRSRQDIARFFGELPLEPPGVVDVTEWPSAAGAKRLPMTTYGGVARVP